MQLEVGSVLQGKISGLAPFGAFVELEKGKSGLVHISEVSDEFVEDVSKHLKVGQEVSVKVLSVDEQGKISLSIKKATETTPKKKNKEKKKEPVKTEFRAPEEFDFGSKKNSESMSFEEMLLKFKHESEEKIQDLKRNTEGKRNGGYKRSY